jgi:hypothetical protein
LSEFTIMNCIGSRKAAFAFPIVSPVPDRPSYRFEPEPGYLLTADEPDLRRRLLKRPIVLPHAHRKGLSNVLRKAIPSESSRIQGTAHKRAAFAQ